MYSYSKNKTDFCQGKFYPSIWSSEVQKLIVSTQLIGIDSAGTIIHTYFVDQPTVVELGLLNILCCNIEWEALQPVTVLEKIQVKEIYVLNPVTGTPEVPVIKGRNMQAGTVIFANEKTKNVLFDPAFVGKPSVKLTMEDVISMPPYRVNITKAGFTVKTHVNFTGTIGWEATEI